MMSRLYLNFVDPTYSSSCAWMLSLIALKKLLLDIKVRAANSYLKVLDKNGNIDNKSIKVPLSAHRIEFGDGLKTIFKNTEMRIRKWSYLDKCVPERLHNIILTI